MFDIIVLAVIGILIIIGFYEGMVRQLFGLAGLVAGYMLAMRYYEPCARFLTSFHHPGITGAISFFVIFLVCAIVAHIIGGIVGEFFDISGLGFLNSIAGGLLGFLKGYLIVCVMFVVLTVFLPAHSGLFKNSHTIKYIRAGTAILKKAIREPKGVRRYLQSVFFDLSSQLNLTNTESPHKGRHDKTIFYQLQ